MTAKEIRKSDETKNNYIKNEGFKLFIICDNDNKESFINEFLNYINSLDLS